MTQVQLAEAIGVKQQTISKWLTKEVKFVEPENATALSRLFGFELSEIVAIIREGSSNGATRVPSLEERVTTVENRLFALEVELRKRR